MINKFFFKFFKNNLNLKPKNLKLVQKLCLNKLNTNEKQLKSDSNIDNKNIVLLLNSFSKSKEKFELIDKSIVEAKNELRIAKMYCCGPTVYDNCHLGHAFTYIRCDLFRRVLNNYCGVYVLMAMNITDIDDKIITKAKQTNSDFKSVANFYYNSFIEDMNSLNIMSPNCYLRVSDHMINIIDYIKHIYKKGFAYVSSNGDLNFDFNHFIKTFNITNSLGTDSPPITEKSSGKKSPKDFALWKSAKAGEPKWDFVTHDGITFSGRPGLTFIYKIFY
jgi:cysteinyl-tRNA synthetase